MEMKSVSDCLNIIDDALNEKKMENILAFQTWKTFINIC